MGELDDKVFVNACKKRFPLEDAGTKGVELCSLWQENVKNSAWHPFKVIKVDDKPMVCLQNIPSRHALCVHAISVGSIDMLLIYVVFTHCYICFLFLKRGLLLVN